MPIYTYECAKCHKVSEHIVKYSERDEPMACDEIEYDRQGQCGGGLVRNTAPEMPTIGKPSFQPGVVLGNGKKVAGHFGKSARKGGWHRP